MIAILYGAYYVSEEDTDVYVYVYMYTYVGLYTM